MRGMNLLEMGRFGLAENKFQKLILSQPNHFDGYDGLARVYAKTGRLEEARILMDHALELASHFVDEGESGPIGQFASRFASKTRHDGPASRNRCSDPTAGRKNGRFARKIASKQE